MAKRRSQNRRQAKHQQKQRQWLIWGLGGVGIAAALIGILLAVTDESRASVSFPDIHGISFTGDGEQLRVATHTGLVAYQEGNWSKPDLPVNDYMGYSGTEDGFFSSGHPGAGSRLVNPIGLVRSVDHGQNVQTINFLGETDFHVMAASYYGDTVYVLNPAPNSLLSAGLHYSLDGGGTWEQSVANGLTSAPLQIAVHPTDPGIVAAGTRAGLFLSEDFGDSFTPVSTESPVTAVAFGPDGERLLFGYGRVAVYDLETGAVTGFPQHPTVVTDQAVLYVAANPVTDALAFATSDRDIFYSSNNGQSWQQIGEDGVSQ
jgi:WD40 repeat protein